MPDSQIPVILSQEALTALVSRLKQLRSRFGSLEFKDAMEVVFIVKLLNLQQLPNSGSASGNLNELEPDTWKTLVSTLVSIADY